MHISTQPQNKILKLYINFKYIQEQIEEPIEDEDLTLDRRAVLWSCAALCSSDFGKLHKTEKWFTGQKNKQKFTKYSDFLIGGERGVSVSISSVVMGDSFSLRRDP